MLLEKISLLSGASISTSLAMPAGKSQHGEGSPLTLPRTANDTTKIGMRFRRSISRNVPKRNSRIPTIRTSLRRNVSARKRRFRKEEGRNFNPTLSLRLFLGQEPRQQLRQRDTARLQPFELRTARFGQRKVHLAFVLFAQFSYHESLALHRPDHLRRIRTGQPQSRPTRVPHAVRGSRATLPRSSTGDIPARNTVRTRRSRATLRVCGRAYSSDYFNRYSSIAFLNASLGIAPCNICGLPLIGMKRIDGMLRMPNAAARSGSFSVLTL